MNGFKLYTNKEHNNFRIFPSNEDTSYMSEDKWQYEGVKQIDDLIKYLPIYIVEGLAGFDIVEVKERSLKVKSDDGTAFFMPKSALFKGVKTNIKYWYYKSMKEKQNFVRSKF